MKIALGGGITSHNKKEKLFDRIVSVENLFTAWREFRRGKNNRRDAQEFEYSLENNIFDLHYSLKDHAYQHGGYESFYVHDPKRRHIHKASVRDRLLHHAVFRLLEPIFERKFIFDSWSCRKRKGTHRAVGRFQKLAWRLCRNGTRTVWVLKLDIRKFFESVQRDVLLKILAKTVGDSKTLQLLSQIIGSFSALPLGNLTSQLFANIYLNELDQFVKHRLKTKVYVRYCDDFVLAHCDRATLEHYLESIKLFLKEHLRLQIHGGKIVLQRYHQGIDFLGFVCFPHFRILRTSTKRRMLRKLKDAYTTAGFNSYLGLIKHCRSRGIKMEMVKKIVYNDGKCQKLSRRK